MLISLYLTNPHVSFYHACTPTQVALVQFCSIPQKKRNTNPPKPNHQVHNLMLSTHYC